MAGKRAEYEQVLCLSQDELRDWLSEHHAMSAGIWLVYFKQSSGMADLTYDQIVDEVLCFGWIDSLPGKVDADRTRLLLTPRNRGSGWSRINKAKIERLLAAERMTPAGQARIAAAIADGSWTLLDDIEAMIVPDDLKRALASAPEADGNFQAFAPSVKKPLLLWVQSAKRAETRQKRIETIVESSAENRNPLKWIPKAER